MEEKAQRIVDIINDYENNAMTPEHVIDWVSQFEREDQEFILDELAVIFEKTYFSKAKCKEMLSGYLKFLKGHYKYADVPTFLRETVFLDLQLADKSQSELLSLLEEIIQEEYQMPLADCGKIANHYLYLDDVLSTGNTIYGQISNWLNEDNEIDASKTNFAYLKAHNIKLSVCLLCLHQWGYSNVEYRLMMNVDAETKKYITYFRFYEIENNLKALKPALNLMLPVDSQLAEVGNYLATLEEATANADRAFRKANQPVEEKLFSSPENRTRIENIFLKKGIEILGRVQNLTVKSIRPLGYTVKSHKTLGLGTLFFTYRNIPNNCPIVFWWGNNNWRPLFVLKNRGDH
ncbi:hypothetical protein IDJ77_15095 [Mucilaginibacter sp. ZT4R22]|uniref:PRTase-CE domain-containing protein n=1 Tax=Mucilaginibacter pankratovii TaxID=2772110 RepID=A0ABR7WS59_9SPHI|nr:hypothetical protein [Mucilaginibacter pankratovii]MBD1365141.1 hypothetical protein [Mucilaginibacter pankratovii]